MSYRARVLIAIDQMGPNYFLFSAKERGRRHPFISGGARTVDDAMRSIAGQILSRYYKPLRETDDDPQLPEKPATDGSIAQ